MKWDIQYFPDARRDLRELDGSQRILIRKAIERISGNPLPLSEGGYGKPLGNKGGANLSGLLKIKLKSAGLRVVCFLRRTEAGMTVVVIGAREGAEVYKVAQERMKKYRYRMDS